MPRSDKARQNESHVRSQLFAWPDVSYSAGRDDGVDVAEHSEASIVQALSFLELAPW